MLPEPEIMIAWCVAMSLLTLGYGEYATWRLARGRPIPIKERIRNLWILFAFIVGSSAGLWAVVTGLPVSFAVSMLRSVAAVALAPIGFWYLFDLPLRLARDFSRRAKATPPTSHPLDGAWPAAPSFLDRIAADRDPTTRRPLAVHHPSPALDRIARLRPDESSPGHPL